MTRLRGCTLRADPQAFGGVEEVLPGSGEGLGVVGGALWEGLSGDEVVGRGLEWNGRGSGRSLVQWEGLVTFIFLILCVQICHVQGRDSQN